jgi:O-6-methylguanine DNA methyltransferase
MTYAAVAAAVGRPGAARAVGAAMAANRFAPMIPCHRVVGSDGSLRGYAGGVEMKRYLITLEAGSTND